MIERLFPFVLILAAIGIFFGYVNPTYANVIRASQTKIQSYDRALKAADEYAARRNDLLNERNQISSENLSRLQAFLPDNVDNVQLILDLSNLASRTNVTLSGFSINQGTGASNDVNAGGTTNASDGLASVLSSGNLTDSLDVSVNVVGSYDSFRNFLQQTEQSLRLLDVTNLVVTPGTSGVYTYSVTFRLYWLH